MPEIKSKVRAFLSVKRKEILENLGTPARVLYDGPVSSTHHVTVSSAVASG
jgi:hypothetical protein